MATYFSSHLLTGDHASRPAANTVPEGTLYSCTDHDLVYQSDGATWSTWATLGGGGGGGGGAFEWLDTQTASNSASLNFEGIITSDHRIYRFEFLNLVPATDGADFLAQVGTGGTPTYQTSSYTRNYFNQNANTFNGVNPGAGQSSIIIANSVDNDSGWSLDGWCQLYNPAGALYKKLVGQSLASAANALYQFAGGGAWVDATAVTAIRFLFSSGNITSGIIQAYGLTHA